MTPQQYIVGKKIYQVSWRSDSKRVVIWFTDGTAIIVKVKQYLSHPKFMPV